MWGSTDDGGMDKRGGMNEGSMASLRDAWGSTDDSGADERGSVNIQHGLHTECPSSRSSSARWMPLVLVAIINAHKVGTTAARQAGWGPGISLGAAEAGGEEVESG